MVAAINSPDEVHSRHEPGLSFTAQPPPARSNPIVSVDKALITNTSISAAAFRLYMLLLTYAREKMEAWPSQQTLASGLGISDRQVRNLLQELITQGLIASSKRGLNNCYHLLDTDELPDESEINYRKNSSAISSNEPVPEENFCNYRNNITAISSSEPIPEENFRNYRNNITGISLNPVEPEENFRNLRKNSSDESESCDSCVCNTTKKAKEGKIEPSQEEIDCQKITGLFQEAGFSTNLALELTRKVLKNERDENYVRTIISYSTQPEIKNPGGFINHMINKNAQIVPRLKPIKTSTLPKSVPASIFNPKTTFRRDHPPVPDITSSQQAETITEQPVDTFLDEDESVLVHPSHPTPPPPVTEEPTAALPAVTTVEQQAQIAANQLTEYHHKLQERFAETLGQPQEAVEKWREILEHLDGFARQYFSPAFGWLDRPENEPPIFRVFFRNRFDLRAATHHVGELRQEINDTEIELLAIT